MPVKKQLNVPVFESEAEEARWWDRNRAAVEKEIRRRVKEGTALTLEQARAQAKTRLQPVTLRLPSEDLNTARELAAEKGLGYQTFIKLLLHEALRRETGRHPKSRK